MLCTGAGLLAAAHQGLLATGQQLPQGLLSGSDQRQWHDLSELLCLHLQQQALDATDDDNKKAIEEQLTTLSRGGVPAHDVCQLLAQLLQVDIRVARCSSSIDHCQAQQT